MYLPSTYVSFFTPHIRWLICIISIFLLIIPSIIFNEFQFIVVGWSVLLQFCCACVNYLEGLARWLAWRWRRAPREPRIINWLLYRPIWSTKRTGCVCVTGWLAGWLVSWSVLNATTMTGEKKRIFVIVSRQYCHTAYIGWHWQQVGRKSGIPSLPHLPSFIIIWTAPQQLVRQLPFALSVVHVRHFLVFDPIARSFCI